MWLCVINTSYILCGYMLLLYYLQFVINTTLYMVASEYGNHLHLYAYLSFVIKLFKNKPYKTPVRCHRYNIQQIRAIKLSGILAFCRVDS